MPDVTTPVLVVGAGPAGLATSLSLSRHGVPHLLVEKNPGTAHSPRTALGFNHPAHFTLSPHNFHALVESCGHKQTWVHSEGNRG